MHNAYQNGFHVNNFHSKKMHAFYKSEIFVIKTAEISRN